MYSRKWRFLNLSNFGFIEILIFYTENQTLGGGANLCGNVILCVLPKSWGTTLRKYINWFLNFNCYSLAKEKVIVAIYAYIGLGPSLLKSRKFCLGANKMFLFTQREVRSKLKPANPFLYFVGVAKGTCRPG